MIRFPINQSLQWNVVRVLNVAHFGWMSMFILIIFNFQREKTSNLVKAIMKPKRPEIILLQNQSPHFTPPKFNIAPEKLPYFKGK